LINLTQRGKLGKLDPDGKVLVTVPKIDEDILKVILENFRENPPTVKSLVVNPTTGKPLPYFSGGGGCVP